jgi:hypothetical protein
VVYVLFVIAITAIVYIPAVLVFVREGRGTANLALVSVGLLLNLLSFGITTLGSIALTFAMPSIVLATERGGIAGGLRVREVLNQARASMVNTLIAGLMLIAANFIGSVGLIACGIGVVFTAAYALAMQAWIVRSFELGTTAPAAA